MTAGAVVALSGAAGLLSSPLPVAEGTKEAISTSVAPPVVLLFLFVFTVVVAAAGAEAGGSALPMPVDAGFGGFLTSSLRS
uniref:Putative secreted peptide n=1 Tax=Anopheles braziliensis TaxID=58242 RepID=A0A2M3ZW37_9DIPT